MIANADFVLFIVKNGKIRFSFDKPQTASTALFITEQKKKKKKNLLVMLLAEDLAVDDEYDGIELTYNDNA